MKTSSQENKAAHHYAGHNSGFHPSVFEENLPANHPHPHFDRAILSWIAPEYLQHPKSVRWWTGAAIITLIAILLEAISGNWTMLAATITFAAVYYFTHEFRPPRHTKINISDLGVKVGHRKILYSEIEFFWIIYNPPEVKRLFLRIKDTFMPDLILELETQDPHTVKAVLEKHLIELIGVREHLTDHVLRLLKL